MNRKVVSGIILTLLLVGVLALQSNVVLVASTGFNLIQNPGFKDEMAFWHVSMGTATYIADSMNPRSGLYCARGTELHEGSLGRLYQDLTGLISPGKRYKISGWIKTQNVVGCVVIALNYVNDLGVTPADGYVKEIGYPTGTTDWTYYESDVFTLPPMPSDASAVWFLFDFNAGKGTAWWDDVSLIESALPTYNVLIDEGHSEWLVSGNAQTLIQALEDKGYVMDAFSGVLTHSLLGTYSVIVIGTAWGSFAQSEIQAIEDFVKNGGGLWLMGLGWSWVDYHPGSTLEDYPMNKIAQRFGAFFNPDIIFDPTNYTNVPGSAIFHSPFIESHPVTEGVTSIGATGALHGSISIQSGTLLITGDDDSYGGYHESPYPNPGSHPPNCAAIQYGLGKVIVISQEGFFTDGHINEFDNKMLGLNIVDWLETIVIPAGVDVDPDTLNLKSKGKWITCYIELPEGYDVFDIDVSTIMMNDTIPAELHPAEIGDHDEDGVLDLMVKFNRTMVSEFMLSKSITYDNVTLTITGEVDGILFGGTDNIRCVGAPVQHTFHFLAWIDGSDWLYLQGNEVWYVHRNYQFLGINPPCPPEGYPTYINGDPWYPEWPDDWGYDDYGQRSLNTYTNLYPPLYHIISFTIIEARWSVSIVQYSSSGNEYTTIILLDDDPPGGAAWYEFELSYTSLARNYGSIDD